ncbi:putative ferric-chelate reductase 1 [Austrofundulus limnaeus]|uniref:Ferric-chelate reductase 1 n=1 Tax=Austrofundulus limnaeus TaxID=52670 RepID=A0A2I4BL78_AUSLI|nr:PREDICTED: putative ferric-chelate reductase 1 [Austrofundulus limnaeus]
MERTLILFFATLMVFGTSGVQAQFSFATNVTVNITRTGCGSTKLCVQQPNACDPAGSSGCLFGSSAVVNATANDFFFQLSGNVTGNSTEFVALQLNPNSTTNAGLIFACIQNNSTFSFQTFMMNSAGNVTRFNRTVTQIRGLANTTKIQCEFSVANLTVSGTASLLRSQDNAFSFSLASGTLNGESLVFAQTFRAGVLDLANPTANVANTTTAPNTTTPASGSNRALHSEGVLLLTGILSLAFLKTA